MNCCAVLGFVIGVVIGWVAVNALVALWERWR